MFWPLHLLLVCDALASIGCAAEHIAGTPKRIGVNRRFDESRADFYRNAGERETPTKKRILQSVDKIEVLKGETDEEGKYVIDALVVYSTGAEQHLREKWSLTVEEHYHLQETIQDYIWKMSGIEDLRLRVVGVITGQPEFCVDEPALRWVDTWAEDKRKRHGADIVAYFVHGECVDESGHFLGGMGLLTGYTSIVATFGRFWVWPHELGHNAGIEHCGHDGTYAQDIEHKRGTIMCHKPSGPRLPVYSNPSMQFDGKPLGDIEKADAVRVWREEKFRLSGRARHVVPFKDPLMDVRTSRLWMTDGKIYPFTVPERATKMVLRAHPISLENYEAQFQLLARSAQRQSWDYQTFRFNVSTIVVNNPASGKWLISSVGANVEMHSEVHCFGDETLKQHPGNQQGRHRRSQNTFSTLAPRHNLRTAPFQPRKTCENPSAMLLLTPNQYLKVNRPITIHLVSAFELYGATYSWDYEPKSIRLRIHSIDETKSRASVVLEEQPKTDSLVIVTVTFTSHSGQAFMRDLHLYVHGWSKETPINSLPMPRRIRDCVAARLVTEDQMLREGYPLEVGVVSVPPCPGKSPFKDVVFKPIAHQRLKSFGKVLLYADVSSTTPKAILTPQTLPRPSRPMLFSASAVDANSGKEHHASISLWIP